ncbi:(d)CMP kinase [Alkalihalobacterium bogoriense]|uniref:(d)CMP kinase n=1 Tax=Alkalihalobacterium bogoriense TaxID=246272 RepID=UPI00047BEA6F|nr:(d)CMP kinase [Alkalihalobacterium bogoriense]
MKKRINIAIDGPAGAGKSTVAKRVADHLSYLYIDTGAMYRALTYFAIKQGINLENELLLSQLLDTIQIQLKVSEEGTYVFVNDENVTEAIRSSEVTNLVSTVAKHRAIRMSMLNMQREMAKEGGAVLDGRDIGTHVLPNAEVKVFLTASVDERAKRRHEQNIEKGLPSDIETLKQEIATRDELDSSREVAPLQKAEDAIEINTTTLTIDEVVTHILELVNERV